MGSMLFVPGFLLSGTLQTAAGREIARNNRYYVECFYIKDEPLVHGFDNIEDARKHAVRHTAGMYHLNGRLNDKEAKIYAKGGKLIERIISGLSETEYNKVRAERGAKNDGVVRAVVSFGWNH